MTRTTRLRLILTMVTAAAFTGIGVVTLIGHFNAHGVLDPETVRWIVGSLFIEWLAYEAYTAQERAATAIARLKKVTA